MVIWKFKQLYFSKIIYFGYLMNNAHEWYYENIVVKWKFYPTYTDIKPKILICHKNICFIYVNVNIRNNCDHIRGLRSFR